jgi:Holliday junction resolvase RusA-like endonuclease
LIDVKTKLEIDPDKNYEDISLLLEEIVKYDDIRYKLKARSSGQVIRRLKENLKLYEIPYDDYIVVNHSTFSTNKYYKNGDESIECKRWKLSFESELRKALRAKNIREIEDLQVDSDEIMFIDFIFKVREMPKHSKDRFKKDYCQIDVDNLVKAPLDVITKVFNIRDENGRYNDNNFRPHADKFPEYAENGTYPNYGENEQIWFAIRNVTKKELNRLQEFDNKKNN